MCKNMCTMFLGMSAIMRSLFSTLVADAMLVQERFAEGQEFCTLVEATSDLMLLPELLRVHAQLVGKAGGPSEERCALLERGVETAVVIGATMMQLGCLADLAELKPEVIETKLRPCYTEYAKSGNLAYFQAQKAARLLGLA